MSRPTWLQASFLLMGLTLLSRLMGYFRDTMIALRFGASATTDAYLIAFTLPSYLVGIISGAINAVLLPQVARRLSADDQVGAWRLVAGAVGWVSLSTAVLIAVLELGAPVVLHLLAPGFRPAELALAVSLARILLLYVFFSSLAYLFGAVLNAHHRFVYAALAPSLLSGAAVAVMVFMANPPIHLVALALLAGSVLQLLMQVLPLVRSGLSYLAWPRLSDPGVRHMVRLSVPTFASNSVGSGNVMIDRIFGSTLATGSIAALAFADRVVQVPFGVFGAAVSTALFPRFAEALESKQPGRLVRAFSGGVRLIVLITFPVAALMLFLAPPLIDVLFRHGAFTQQAADLTALCLRAYALALIPYSLNMVMMRVYYSLEKTAELAVLGVGMLALNAIGDAILVRVMGAPGIALATVLVEGSFSWLLISRLRPHLPGLDLRSLVRASAPVALSAVLAGAVASVVSGLLPVASTLQAAGATLAGVVVLACLFYGFCRGLRVPEARRLGELRALLAPQKP